MSSERTRKPDEVFCRYCGELVSVHAEVCPHCGVRNEQYRRLTGQTNRSTGNFSRSMSTTTDGTGVDANVAAALSYVLGFVSGLVVYVVKEDRFARFHAAQSIVVSGAAISVLMTASVVAPFFMVVSFVIGVGFVWPLLTSLIFFVMLGLWVFLIVTAYQGKTSRIPVAANIADKLVSGPNGVSRTPSDDSADTDALAALRTRYARGEIDEVEFERRLEQLLETEHENERRREPTDLERSR